MTRKKDEENCPFRSQDEKFKNYVAATRSRGGRERSTTRPCRGGRAKLEELGAWRKKSESLEVRNDDRQAVERSGVL